MMTKPNIRCYLCNQETFVVRPGQVRDMPDMQILECVACGLVTLNSIGHIQVGHYEESGMHGASIPTIESWLRETERDDQRRLDMLRISLTNRKLLDFGCGAGGFLKKAKSVAAQVAGIELERRVREYWSETIPMFAGVEDAGADYDVITAFHVIEHLTDPRAMLEALGARLAKGGRLVVEVPSAEDALLTLYENEAFQRFTYWSQHLYLFNADTLTSLAKKAGLKVISTQQLQRYPLSIISIGLAAAFPGDINVGRFWDTPALTEAYADSLAALGRCDTIIAHLERD